MLFLLANLLIWQFSLANPTCQPGQNFAVQVNLTSQMGSIKDQGPMGWCYAYTAADLISHKYGIEFSAKAIALNYIKQVAAEKMMKVSDIFRKSTDLHLLSKRISENMDQDEWITREISRKKGAEAEILEARLMALRETQNNLIEKKNKLTEELSQKSDLIDGGKQKLAIEMAFKQGACLDADVPSDSSHDHTNTTHEYFKDLAGISDYNRLEELYELRENRTWRQLCRSAFAANFIAPLHSANEYMSIFSRLDQDPIDIILGECKKRTRPFGKIPEVIHDSIDPKMNRQKEIDRLFLNIDKVLDGGYPVAVVLDADIFKRIDPVKDKTFSHSVSIAGRAYDCQSGETVYIVRNSWGKNFCKNRIEEFNKAKQAPPFKCDSNGYFLVPKMHLMKGLAEMTYLKKG